MKSKFCWFWETWQWLQNMPNSAGLCLTMITFSWSLICNHSAGLCLTIIRKYSAGLCLAAGSPASSLPSMPSSTGFPSFMVCLFLCLFLQVLVFVCLFFQVLTSPLIPGLMWPGSLSPSHSENTSPCLSYSLRWYYTFNFHILPGHNTFNYWIHNSSVCQKKYKNIFNWISPKLLVDFIFIITSVCSLAAWVTTLPTENPPTRLFNLLSFFSPGISPISHQVCHSIWPEPGRHHPNFVIVDGTILMINCPPSLAFTITWQFAQFVLLIQVISLSLSSPFFLVWTWQIPNSQALALFGLATVGVLDKDRVSRLLSVHLSVMLSVWSAIIIIPIIEWAINIIPVIEQHRQYMLITGTCSSTSQWCSTLSLSASSLSPYSPFR